MPPRRYSRFSFSDAYLDTDGALLLSEPEPFRFVALSDNIEHVVGDGDSLYTIADLYYASLPRGAGLWWVIADFQPSPIVDPTIALTPGATVYVPSLRTVTEIIFNEARRAATIG